MRLLVFLIILPIVLISGNKDSLTNSHYKVKFSLQNKFSYSKFQYTYNEFYNNYNHGYSSGNVIYFDGNPSSLTSINPELKVDFELSFWLKITCGINYNVMRFNSDYGEMYNTYNLQKQQTTGYFKDKTQLTLGSTFLGLGMSKQFRKFNFEIDYSFSVYKALLGKRIRSNYDVNYNFQNDDKTKNMKYGGGLDRFIFSHNISTSLNYRLYKHISLKLGYVYSMYLRDVYYEGTGYYMQFKNIKTHSFIFGICFSII